MWSEAPGKHSFKSYTYEKLKEEMLSFACEPPYMSTYEQVKWARQCHSSVSVLEYDARYRKFATSYCKTHKETACMSAFNSSQRTTISTLFSDTKSKHEKRN